MVLISSIFLKQCHINTWLAWCMAVWIILYLPRPIGCIDLFGKLPRMKATARRSCLIFWKYPAPRTFLLTGYVLLVRKYFFFSKAAVCLFDCPVFCRAYKEHFIHAKYARKEFETEGGTAHYETGRKDGKLWKRGKDDKQFKLRRFILNAEEGTLKYYVKPDVSCSVMYISFLPAIANINISEVVKTNTIKFKWFLFVSLIQYREANLIFVLKKFLSLMKTIGVA